MHTQKKNIDVTQQLTVYGSNDGWSHLWITFKVIQQREQAVLSQDFKDVTTQRELIKIKHNKPQQRFVEHWLNFL